MVSQTLSSCSNIGLDMDIVKSLAYFKLGEVPNILKFFDKLRDQQKQVLVLDSYCIEGPVILYQPKRAILFLIKKTSVAMGDLKDYICPAWRFLAMNVFSSNCSAKNKEYILDILSSAPRISSIVWSYLQ